MPYYTYILKCADGTLYTGWTTNLDRRVATHNAGRGGRYTRMHRPVTLIYWECYATRSQAQRREIAIKRMRRDAKLGLTADFDI